MIAATVLRVCLGGDYDPRRRGLSIRTLANTSISRLAAVAAASLVTGLAACGDDDEGPSKSEYVAQADAVCAAADVKLDAIFRSELGGKPNPKQAQAGLRAMLPEERKLLSELRALETPEGDRDEIDRIWAARQRAVDGLEAAARSPASAIAYVADEEDEGERGFAEASRLASEYGLVDCEATHPGSVAAP